MLKTLRRLAAICRPFWPVMAFMLTLIVLQRAASITIPRLTGRLVDALAHQAGAKTALTIVVVIGMVLVVENLLGAAQWYIDTRYLRDPLRGHVLRTVIGHLCTLSIGQHRSEHSGIRRDIITTGQSALHSIVNTLTNNAAPLIAEIVFVVWLLFAADWRIGTLFVMGGSVFIAWSFRMNTRLYPNLESLQETQRMEGKKRGELLVNIVLAITCGRQERVVSETYESWKRSYDHQMSVWTPYIKTSTFRNMVLVITRVATSGLGVWLVIKGQMTLGGVVTVWGLTNSALAEVQGIGYLWRELLVDSAALSKLLQILDTTPAVVVKEDPIRPQRFSGAITLEEVSFTYQGKHNKETVELPSLDRISLDVRPGEQLAVVGTSGAGKSTLVHILLRGQDPDSGRITIDGHDLRDLDPVHLRQRIGVVLQMPHIFAESLRYNVAFGASDTTATDEAVEQACHMASLTDLLGRLPQGLNTYIGERGIRLSGGEQQRVGIARALIHNPDILILDEATSNLDPENEERIRQAIKQASVGRTTLIIAHRFSTIRDAHRVLVMERGRVADIGTHQELSQRSPAYQRLVAHQLAGVVIDS